MLEYFSGVGYIPGDEKELSEEVISGFLNSLSSFSDVVVFHRYLALYT